MLTIYMLGSGPIAVPVLEKLYQQAQAAGMDPNMAGAAGAGPDMGASSAAPNDNVVDADFEVVDEDK